jgi:hypothetical protein
MALLNANNLTLADWAKRLDPDGSVPLIANLLAQTNEILTDAVWVEGNLPTGHRVTVATGLPLTYYRALNQGIPTSKATTAQVDEGASILEARSEIDLDLVMLNGNTQAFRLSEARLFLESMNQAWAQGLFYNNPSVDPKQFLGLAPRYSLKTGAGNSQNVIDGAGATANQQTSMWFVCWSDNTVFCIFPKGSKAGLLQEDLGRQTSFDTGSGTGTRMEVLAERFQWKGGLVVKDWRYAVRIANLGSDLFAALSGVLAPTALTNLLHLMMRAIARIPNPRMGRCAFYCNRSVFTMLMRVALEKSNAALSLNAAMGQFGEGPTSMLSFLGYPIRLCDGILNTEAVVT